ncbi:MAG: GNAT family protein, partial [Candidatus Thermoplasmatota archaeon]
RLRTAARAAGTALPFLIRTADGQAVGSTSIFDISPNHTMEVGHTWIGASVRRTAVNTECKRLVLDHCFGNLAAIRVQLKCDERNQPSRRAIERLGATYEGTIRNQMTLADGHLRQARVYSIVAAEWPAVRDRLDSALALHSP